MSFCSPSYWGPFVHPDLLPIGEPADVGDFTPCFEEFVIVALFPLTVLLAFGVFTLASLLRTSWSRVQQDHLADRAPLLDYDATPYLTPQQRATRQLEDLEDFATTATTCNNWRCRKWVHLRTLAAAISLAFGIAETFVVFIDDFPTYQRVATSLVCFSWMFALLLVYLEVRHAKPSSFTIIIFYVTLVVTGAVKLRTIAIQNVMTYWEIMYICTYAVNCVGLLLSLVGLEFVKHDMDWLSFDKLEESASFLSRVTYWWVSPLLRFARDSTLSIHELSVLREKDTSQAVNLKFRSIIEKNRSLEDFHLGRCVWALEWKSIVLQSFILFWATAFTFVAPICLYPILLKFDGIREATGFMIGLLFGPLVVSILEQAFMHIGVRIGIRINGAVVGAVYRKTLALSLSSRTQLDTTIVSNLIVSDARKLRDLFLYLPRLWAAPLQIIAAIIVLIGLLGPPAMAGVLVMLFIVLLNTVVSHTSGKLQMQSVSATESRMNLLSRILEDIRTIKLLHVEGLLKKKVFQAREEEMTRLRRNVYFQAASFLFWQGAPLVVSLVTFGTYALVYDEPIEAAPIFTAVALFNVLKMPVYLLPVIFTKCSEGYYSFKQLNIFLSLPELEDSARRPDTTEGTVSLREASFKFDEYDADLCLRNVSVDVPAKSLTLVVGNPSSGKTSLLMGMLGELTLISGDLEVSGRIAYVDQQPWILAGTIKDNILFGLPFDPDYYEKTIVACGLVKDFLLFGDGDEEEVGEKGIKLTNDQLQRVCLARAAYSALCGHVEIIIMDSPLSDVEPNVGKSVFQDCIVDLLKDYTRIVVTNQLQLSLPLCDYCIVVANHEIAQQGTPQALLPQPGPLLNELLATSRKKDKTEGNASMHYINQMQKMDPGRPQSREGSFAAEFSSSASTPFTPVFPGYSNISPAEDDRLAETIYQRIMKSPRGKRGKTTSHFSFDADANSREKPLSLEVIKTYYHASLGLFQLTLLVVIFGISQAAQVFQDFWLSWWVVDQFYMTEPRYFNLYAILTAAALIFIVIRSFVCAFGCLRASSVIHNDMLSRLFRAPVSFFQKTPVSLILARFGADLQVTDTQLSPELCDLFTFTFAFLGNVVLICIITPFFVIGLLPVLVVLGFVSYYYVAAVRQLKRLDEDARQRFHQFCGETIRGVTTIRAYNVSGMFVAESERLLDDQHRTLWSTMAANRWLGIRLEFVGSMVVFFTGIFVLLQGNVSNGAMAGLSITNALSVTNILNWLVRTVAEVDSGFLNVQHLMDISSVPNEAADIVENHRRPRNWPSRGRIQLRDVSVRYGSNFPPALKGISLDTKKMEKIGIVGGKGSGRSCLAMSLFRMFELEEGFIKVDDVDISLLGLADLRTSFSIIPAKSLLFPGTLRENLDPEFAYSDKEIWESLRSAHMEEHVYCLPNQLNTVVATGDEVMNGGQKLLFSLARALLKRSKVIVIEEIPPEIDSVAAAQFQKIIRMEFTEVTVICVSHNLRNIIDYDRILILDRGSIVEFDSPSALLSSPTSRFYALCVETGELDQLLHLAGQKEYVLEELSASMDSGEAEERDFMDVRAYHDHSASHAQSAGSGGAQSSSGSGGHSGSYYSRPPGNSFYYYTRSRSFVGSMMSTGP